MNTDEMRKAWKRADSFKPGGAAPPREFEERPITSNYRMLLDAGETDSAEALCILHLWAAGLNRLCDKTVVRDSPELQNALQVWKSRMFIDPTKLTGQKEASRKTEKAEVVGQNELERWLLDEWGRISSLKAIHAEYVRVGNKYDRLITERCVTIAGKNFKFDIVFDFGCATTIVGVSKAMCEFVKSDEYRAVLGGHS